MQKFADYVYLHLMYVFFLHNGYKMSNNTDSKKKSAKEKKSTRNQKTFSTKDYIQALKERF